MGVIPPDDGTVADPTVVTIANQPIAVTGGGSPSTEYTEGDVDATITGVAAMWEDSGNTLRSVSAAKPLPVNVVSGVSPTGDPTHLEDDPHVSGDRGSFMLGVNNPSENTLVDNPGDYTPICTDDAGRIYAVLRNSLPGGGNALGYVNLRDTTNTNQLFISAARAAKVDGSAVTQPISAATLPLPLGAATEATLGSVLTAVTGTISVTGGLTDTQLRASAVPVSGTFFQATQPISAASLPLPTGAAAEHITAGSPHSARLTDGTSFYKATTPSDTQPVSASSLPLPTGASTLASQATGNASLASIDGKLTSPLTVTGALTDTQLRATAVPVSNASLPLPSGAATSANQTTANASLSSIDSKLTSPVAVTGALTDAQLRATAVPVSNASLPLPSGAATSANQTTANSSLSSIDGKLPAALVGGRLDENVGAWLGSTAPTVGQKTMANSVPMVVASDQTAIPVSESGVFTVQPGNTQNTTPWLVQDSPATSGGNSVGRLTDVNDTGQVLKGSAGQLYGWFISNHSVVPIFVKIYNKATAPTSGNTPVMTLEIPANASANVNIDKGVSFSLGIGFRCTTVFSDADGTNPNTNDCTVNAWFK